MDVKRMDFERMEVKQTFAARRIGLSVLVVLTLVMGGGSVHAASYSPLFAEDMLSTLDPATRERFAALEDENYRRWLNRNPQQRDVEAAKRQHLETEAILARFAETRRIEELARKRDAENGLGQKEKCERVAAEIAELSEGGSFYEAQDDGERRYFSDEEVSQRIEKQQTSYNKHCKK